MPDPAAALQTQIRHIEAKTGRPLAELTEMVRASGLAKHGEVRAMLMDKLSLGYGDANTLAHLAKAAPPAPADADPLDAIYTGAKAPLRPLHDKMMKAIAKIGPHELAPKKGYVSLRRKKQFAMLGPATKDLLELGLNAKGLPDDPRLKPVPAGGMCQYKVRFGDPKDIDAAMLGWIRAAYDAAG